MKFSHTITIEIENSELDLAVDFDFVGGTPAKIDALPEDCYPEEPDEYEIDKAFIVFKDGSHDVSYLIGDIYESIEDRLEDCKGEWLDEV